MRGGQGLFHITRLIIQQTATFITSVKISAAIVIPINGKKLSQFIKNLIYATLNITSVNVRFLCGLASDVFATWLYGLKVIAITLAVTCSSAGWTIFLLMSSTGYAA